MQFYQSLQLDPVILKQKMKEAKTKKEKRHWLFTLISRSFLIVLFAVVFISLITKVFGMETKAFAVVFFCMLLSLRFVDFGYNITQSIMGLAGIMVSLFIVPEVQLIPSSLVQLVIHFLLISLILLVSSSNPLMGNASLYGFSYIFIVYSTLGQKIDQRYLLNQSILFGLSFLLFALIFYQKHRNKNQGIGFFDVWTSEKHILLYWLLTYAFSLSALIVSSSYFDFQRFMWIGFAFSSLYSSYGFSMIDLRERVLDRILGTIFGSILYVLANSFLPSTLLSLLGGFALGICSSYRYKTIFNCFGALSIASVLFGTQEAALMRIIDNLFGVVAAILSIWLVKSYQEKSTWMRVEEGTSQK